MTDENLPLWEVSPIDPTDPAWKGWPTDPQQVRAASPNDAIDTAASNASKVHLAAWGTAKPLNPWSRHQKKGSPIKVTARLIS
ncbi:hypothetical protein [Caulobacter radicis]|uniref:hypothetical protein n=1 Tax=Caulobacter radicis TaxID=2172650 RepID=UPI001A9C600D|nr:hypothetical protein [Caulobacter radicis]